MVKNQLISRRVPKLSKLSKQSFTREINAGPEKWWGNRPGVRAFVRRFRGDHPIG
jgi:hypothetical protein